MKEERKELIGRVISNKMQKTVVVQVERLRRHPRYGKVVGVRKKFYAHDEEGACQNGDVVRITETRPLSRLKRWTVAEILERAELPEELRV